MPLDRGQNIEYVLKTVSTAAPGDYKIVWEQDGPITNYQIGDTLLIDDIEISEVLPRNPINRNPVKEGKQ